MAAVEVELSQLSSDRERASLAGWPEGSEIGEGGDDTVERVAFEKEAESNMILSRIMAKATSTSRRAFEDTLWEVSILLRLPNLAPSNSVFLAISLIVNIVIQSTFCVVLYSRIIGQEELRPDSFRIWRETVGQHADSVDERTWTSMTSRLCGQDESLALSTGQGQALGDIGNYLARVQVLFTTWRAGTALLAVALLVWCMVILKEMWACVYFIRVLRTFPLGTTTHLQPLLEDDELTFEIVGLSYGRFGGMVFITIYRFTVATALLVLGSFWLSETTQISEVILNTVAMIFVLDVDELLFAVGIPQPTKVLYESIRRVPVKTVLRFGVDATPIINSFVCVLFLTCIMLLNHKAQTTMVETNATICGDNQQFAIDVHGPTGLYYSTRTKKFDREALAVRGSWSLAVTELLEQDPDELNKLSVNKSVFIEDRYIFDTLRSETMRDRMARIGSCEDFVASSPEGPAIISTLQRQLNTSTSTKTCAGFAAVKNVRGLSRCHSYSAVLLRATCPVTCGCDRPRGLLLNGPSRGCPRNVCEHNLRYRRERNDRVFGGSLAGCVDATLSELQESEEWSDVVSRLYYFNWGDSANSAWRT